MAKPKSKPKRKLTLKQSMWLKLFLDESNPKTFLNQTESARQAGYDCDNENSYRQIGSENYAKLDKHIDKWIDEVGLSEERLKRKLKALTEAKETKFFAYEGVVTDQREVEALGIQRQSLEMAMRVKNMFEKDNQLVPDEITVVLKKE